jgi:RNA 2',3'-cyclic 3'-phosphodiesterase
VRIFIALDISAEVRDSLADLRPRFESLSTAARWVRLENAHITLKFIGEVPDETVERVRATMELLRARPPLELRFAGLGFFPDERRPRVFWVGMEGGAPLTDLVAAIETHLEPLGIAREKRPFRPHLTLARFDSAKGLDPLRKAAAEFAATEFGRASVTEFHVYQSVLKRSGAEYTRLATFTFSPETAP